MMMINDQTYKVTQIKQMLKVKIIVLVYSFVDTLGEAVRADDYSDLIQQMEELSYERWMSIIIQWCKLRQM